MKYIFVSFAIVLAMASCDKDRTPAPAPGEKTLLKDVVIPGLPSPHYHFDYDAAGQYTRASYESGARMYEIVYENGRIVEMKNNTSINKDRIQYMYDANGRVELITYRNEAGTVFRMCSLSYNLKGQLVAAEWESRTAIGFAIDRSLSFSYQEDGNAQEVSDHLHQLESRAEATIITRFTQYDDRTAVDDFSILHENENHIIILPGVQLQKNNPRRVTRTGTGLNYTIDYAYTYNDRKMPARKSGDAVFTNGPNAGQHFETGASYSYY